MRYDIRSVWVFTMTVFVKVQKKIMECILALFVNMEMRYVILVKEFIPH